MFLSPVLCQRSRICRRVSCAAICTPRLVCHVRRGVPPSLPCHSVQCCFSAPQQGRDSCLPERRRVATRCPSFSGASQVLSGQVTRVARHFGASVCRPSPAGRVCVLNFPSPRQVASRPYPLYARSPRQVVISNAAKPRPPHRSVPVTVSKGNN